MRLLAPFASGISCAFLYPQLPESFTILGTGIAFIGLITYCTFYSRWKLWQQKKLLMATTMVFLFAAGICSVLMRSPQNRADHFSKIRAEKLIVHINQEPIISETSVRFTAQVEAVFQNGRITPAGGNLQVFVQTEMADRTTYRYGDELLLPAKFQEVQGPLNPAEFNYKRYLHYQQINHQLFLLQNETALLDHDKGNPVIAFALALRQKMVTKLARHIQDHEALSVASTLLLGYRATLSDETLSAYSRTGTLHVLSVSGMHVALLYWLIAKTLAAFGSKPGARYIRLILSLTLIWAYALLTGFSPPVN
ncbi:MAG: ComEC family competence protein, partial [Mucilaginibacter polytrichastri]|nr:ComEC family competence protein [Mucilaginibacter polytrichastri]